MQEPFAFFGQCHADTRDHCAQLEKLVAEIGSTGFKPPMHERVETLIHFFEGPARDHHADEELVFFPKLLALDVDPGQQLDLRRLIDSLRSDHAMMDGLWHTVRYTLVSSANLLERDVLDDVHTFVAMHRHHMNREDAGVLPLARRYFDANTIREIGIEIADRRQGRY